MSLGNHCVNILVDCLLQVQLVALNLCHVISYVCQSNCSLLQFEARPPGLNTKCSSFSDDFVHEQIFFLLLLPEQGQSNRLLELSYRGNFVQKGLEKAQKLLVLVVVNGSVEVQDRKKNLHNDLKGLALKHKEVVVLIIKYHLVHGSLLLALLQNS